MNNLIKKILVEWSYRLDDGMINLHNPKHMLILSEVLKDMKLPTRAILEVMSNLTEKEKVKPLSDKDKQKMRDMGLIWKGKGYGKEGEKGILFKNVDGKLVKTGDGETQKTKPKVNVFTKQKRNQCFFWGKPEIITGMPFARTDVLIGASDAPSPELSHGHGLKGACFHRVFNCWDFRALFIVCSGV